MLNGKTVLVGITGGIAAYKVLDLIRKYKRAGANVRVVCTPNALEFVTKLTLQSLSQNEVATEQFEIEVFKPEHISCAEEADIMVIAPATANTISKIANGICDNLLTSIACAFNKPLLIAPAMNCNMWENKIIQENISKLENSGIEILSPESGFLACGTEGMGRLCNIDTIFEKTVEVLNNKKKLPKNNILSKKIVITAGGTIENIDPVRYISNYSSGKMGTALADAAYKQGADVVLITTKSTDNSFAQRERVGERGQSIKEILVHSALDMQSAVNAEFNTADCIIMAAAVADYRPKELSTQKIKKENSPLPLREGGAAAPGEGLTLELIQNPDILHELCQKPRNGKIIVGFCAESENLEKNAKEKIKRKGCDYLIANDISRSDIGFSSDENEVLIIDKNLNIAKLEKAPKTVIAKKILDKIYPSSDNFS